MARDGAAGKVVATVLAFDNPSGLGRVLECISVQTRPPDAVIVLDNGGTSFVALDQLPASLAPTTRLTATVQNVGVGAGHNAAISLALLEHPDYLWILEHDTFPDAECLERQLEVLLQGEETQRVGVVVADLARNRYERDVFFSGGDIQPCERFTFNGSLFRRKVFEETGPIREDLFVGLEDWDYSARVSALGWRIVLDTRARGVHPTRGAARYPVIPSPTRHYYSCRNGLLILSRRARIAAAGRQVVAVATDLLHYRSKEIAAARVNGILDGLRNRGGPRATAPTID